MEWKNFTTAGKHYNRPQTISLDMPKTFDERTKKPQNLLLRAQHYNFEIIYKPGKTIPVADAFSRAPTDKPKAEKLMTVKPPLRFHTRQQIRSKTI